MKKGLRNNQYRKLRYYEDNNEHPLILMSIKETLVWVDKMKSKLIKNTEDY